MSGHLNPGGQQFRGDRGEADPRVAAALAAYLAGRGSEQAALNALAAARLLVPVIAVLADGSPAGDQASTASPPVGQAGQTVHGGKASQMMLPTLIGRDGRAAMLAFTCTEALARWRQDARPVPAGADRVWRAAVADGCAVVIDVAGPVPLAVEGARLAELAAGRPAPPPEADPDVRAEVAAAVAAEPALAGFRLSAGRAGGPDLAVRFQPARRGLAARDWEPAASRAAAAIAARLTRLRRGIEISIGA